MTNFLHHRAHHLGLLAHIIIIIIIIIIVFIKSDQNVTYTQINNNHILGSIWSINVYIIF